MIVFPKSFILGASALLLSCVTPPPKTPATSPHTPVEDSASPTSAVNPAPPTSAVNPAPPTSVTKPSPPAAVAKPAEAIPLMKQAVPIPQDLCAVTNHKAIRKRVDAALRRSATDELTKLIASPLVPCDAGKLRVLQFSI